MRENHFNLIRMAAAFAVLVSHSFALTQGVEAQPGAHGIYLGAMAVDVFFVTSGYLVTASLMRRTIVEFTVARVMRIYPALIVAVTVTTVALGFDWNYLWKNALLFPGAPGTIEGVFDANPSNGINGSLWTLPYEVRMYAALAIIGIVFKRDDSWLIVVTIALCSFAWWVTLDTVLARLAWMFFAGSACQLLAVKLSLRTAAVIVLPLTTVFAMTGSTAAYALALPIAVLTVAHIKGPLLAYNRYGDLSYGVYIYAFPVQQSLIAAGLTHPIAVLAAATVIVLPLACGSWHLIEKRALKLKDHVAGHQIFAK
jgi:peptidoglycan/LPS O-acetylase OafA/YrhL